MRRMTLGLIAGLILASGAVASVSSVTANGMARKQAGRLAGGGGNDLPVPFANANQKVELADGEHYALVGKLLQKNGFFYFRPDFDKQPWLASGHRVEWPYYPIELNASVPRELVGKSVRFSGKAVGRVILSDSQDATYQIFLSPESDGGIQAIEAKKH